MRRGRPCPLCAPEIRIQVDALLSTKVPYGEIAQVVGSNKFAVSRHKKHAFPDVVSPVSAGDELAQSDERLRILAEQLSAQYLAALSCADNKVALEITKTLARLEVERHHRLIKKAQTAATVVADDEQWPTQQMFDNVVRKVREAKLKGLSSSGMVPCPNCGGRGSVHPPDQKPMETQNVNSAFQ